MKSIQTPDKIYIGQSKITHAGRGVFALNNIKKGEIIEHCPVIVLSKHEEEELEKSILAEYVYFLGRGKARLTLALGYGSLYNHSYHPNAKYKNVSKNQGITFIAVKNIRKNEEITVNYNQESKNAAPLWFEK